MTKLTKIVGTIGPATESEEILTELIKAGLNVARFNTKHNEPTWHNQVIQRVKNVSEKLEVSVGVLLDLQGPEIRIDLPAGEAFDLATDEEVVITANTAATGKVIIVPEMVITGLQSGNQILLADGACELVVTDRVEGGIKAKAQYPCTIKTRKTMNTPGVVLDLPSLTNRDLTYLEGVDLTAVDYVGLSFVRSAADLEHLRQELNSRNSTAKIIAKIENQAAIDNLDEIIAASDAIMVARGDLAVETPFEELAHWQRLIIAKSREAGKPVITATQMLQSMITNPRPTRAEISDVAHAVYDGTDAVMLSEESAMGEFPVKAVMTQAKIAVFTENHRLPEPFNLTFTTESQNFGQKITQDTANNHYGAVICVDKQGTLALDIARCHPATTVHVLCESPALAAQLSLGFGLQAHEINPLPNFGSDQEIKDFVSQLLPDFDPNTQVLWISAQTLETKVI